MMRSAVRKTFLCGALVLALAACSGKPETGLTSGEGILRYVPAETPYVLAMTKRIPDDVRAKLGAGTRQVMQAYPQMLRAALSQAAEEEAEQSAEAAERIERLTAILDELAAMVTPEGIPAAGIDENSTAALYGVGLLPVLRVTLSDGALFERTFAELEAKAGGKMAVAAVDGHSYRYAADEQGRFIVAVIDDQLVVSFVPAELPEDLLKSVLGLTLPRTSIAASGALAELAATYGYLEYGLGMIDIQRLAATFLDEQSGVNQWLLASMDHDATALTDACRAEIRSMAGIVPRIVTGYTALTARNIATNSVFELRRDLAAGLQTITAPVPGLGREQEGLFSFGMSLDLAAAREFYAARLAAMEANPYECELFADLQAGVARGKAALQQPLPPVAYGVRGFLAVVEDIHGLDFQAKQPPTSIDMRFLLASDNPQGLVAMGAMFSPEIAALNLQPNGKPQKLGLPALASMVDAAYIAMTDDALALSVGAGSERGLTDMLKAAPARPEPFLSVDVDAGRYYGFLGSAITTGIAQSDDPEAAQAAEMMAATSDMMKSFEDLFSRVSFTIRFTERGIEMPSNVSLAE